MKRLFFIIAFLLLFVAPVVSQDVNVTGVVAFRTDTLSATNDTIQVKFGFLPGYTTITARTTSGIDTLTFWRVDPASIWTQVGWTDMATNCDSTTLIISSTARQIQILGPPEYTLRTITPDGVATVIVTIWGRNETR
jgi:hypothetical protein